jgi:RNA polymerase-binding transcription factor DksA
MTQLTPSQVTQLADKLDERLRDLRADIRRELLQSDEERYRDVADKVGDVGDESVASLIADLGAAAVDRDIRELREVDAARERLKAGTCGVCVDCGDDIAWERLLAQPTALRCFPCAQQHEKTHAHEGMPTL